MPMSASPLTIAYLTEVQARHQRELADAVRLCAANDDVDTTRVPHRLNERGEWVAVVEVTPTP